MQSLIPLALISLAACGSEQQASSVSNTTSARGDAAQVALGLTERQLLDADIVDANGQELGDVEAIVRGADGSVSQLLIEIEDSSPDRYVHVLTAGLQPVDDRGEKDLRTTMTRDQLAALPDARR